MGQPGRVDSQASLRVGDQVTDRKDTCASCRFFQLPLGPHHVEGQCRRRAPRCGQYGDTGALHSPAVPSDYWCGEHEPLPEAVKAEEVKAERWPVSHTNPMGVDLVLCSGCDFELTKDHFLPARTHSAWHAHKCEDHQPANEESDS